MSNLNKIIKQVLLEGFNASDEAKIRDLIEEILDKDGGTIDDIVRPGVDFSRNIFLPYLLKKVNNGDFGYTLDDVRHELKYLQKLGPVLTVISKQDVPEEDKNKMYKGVLMNTFCEKCKNNTDVRKAIIDYAKQSAQSQTQPQPTPKVKSKKYTPSEKDMDRLETLAKSNSKANDVWRKYGIGSKSLRMGDYTVTVQLNKDITIGNQDLKKNKNYETTFDKESKSLIYRVRKADIYFNIEHTPRKGEQFKVTDIEVIDRQGKNLKTPVPTPSDLLVGVQHIKEN